MPFRTPIKSFFPLPPQKERLQPQQSGGNLDQIMQAIQQLQKIHRDFLTKYTDVNKAIASVKQGPPGPPGIPGRHGFGVNGKDAVVDEEAIIRKVLAKIKLPKDGRDGRNGESPNPKFIADEIKKHIANGGIKVKTKNIEGWQDPQEVVRRFWASGGIRGGGDSIQYADLSSQCNGSSKTFTIPRISKIVLVISSDAPIVYRPTVDWTVLGTTLTLTNKVNAPSQGATFKILYAA